MTELIIIDNPFEPRSWTAETVSDVPGAIRARYARFPAGAKLYDMAGMDWRRVAHVIDPSILASRDITPRDRAGIDRLQRSPGPIMMVVAPADPITIIIAIVAVIVAVAVSLLLMPKIPKLENRTQGSPNNDLAQRSNSPRPNGRIPEILGTVVGAVPDMLAVAFSVFELNLEKEIAFMCLGRGAYQVSNISDGTTLISSIAGAGVEVYAPFTSPNSGDDPQVRIGTPIGEPVLSVTKLSDVNGQTLRPPNANYVQGSSNIRFTAPETIERDPDATMDFTTYFGEGDQLTVQNANFGGAVYLDATTQDARFYADYRVEFSSFNPTTLYAAGQTLIIANAGYVGVDGTGNPVYGDVSGTYVIDHVTATTIYLVH